MGLSVMEDALRISINGPDPAVFKPIPYTLDRDKPSLVRFSNNNISTKRKRTKDEFRKSKK